MTPVHQWLRSLLSLSCCSKHRQTDALAVGVLVVAVVSVAFHQVEAGLPPVEDPSSLQSSKNLVGLAKDRQAHSTAIHFAVYENSPALGNSVTKDLFTTSTGVGPNDIGHRVDKPSSQSNQIVTSQNSIHSNQNQTISSPESGDDIYKQRASPANLNSIVNGSFQTRLDPKVKLSGPKRAKMVTKRAIHTPFQPQRDVVSVPESAANRQLDSVIRNRFAPRAGQQNLRRPLSTSRFPNSRQQQTSARSRLGSALKKKELQLTASLHKVRRIQSQMRNPSARQSNRPSAVRTVGRQGLRSRADRLAFARDQQMGRPIDRAFSSDRRVLTPSLLRSSMALGTHRLDRRNRLTSTHDVEDANDMHVVRQAGQPISNIQTQGMFAGDRTIDELIESAYMTRTGEFLYPQMASRVGLDGFILTGLDMKLSALQYSLLQPDKQRRQKRKALQFTRWPGGIIPYVIETEQFEPHEIRVIHWAMDQWQKYTCIVFRPTTVNDGNKIVFQDGMGCSSNIGMARGVQFVTLQRSCRKRKIVLHELGHVLGLIHEHQRPERDAVIDIYYPNIRPGGQKDFAMFPRSAVSNFGVQYDFTSIMHYGPTAFSRSPELMTMMTKDPKYQNIIGTADMLSPADIATVNKMYNCGISRGPPPVASRMTVADPGPARPGLQQQRTVELSAPYILQDPVNEIGRGFSQDFQRNTPFVAATNGYIRNGYVLEPPFTRAGEISGPGLRVSPGAQTNVSPFVNPVVSVAVGNVKIQEPNTNNQPEVNTPDQEFPMQTKVIYVQSPAQPSVPQVQQGPVVPQVQTYVVPAQQIVPPAEAPESVVIIPAPQPVAPQATAMAQPATVVSRPATAAIVPAPSARVPQAPLGVPQPAAMVPAPSATAAQGPVLVPQAAAIAPKPTVIVSKTSAAVLKSSAIPTTIVRVPRPSASVPQPTAAGPVSAARAPQSRNIVVPLSIGMAPINMSPPAVGAPVPAQVQVHAGPSQGNVQTIPKQGAQGAKAVPHENGSTSKRLNNPSSPAVKRLDAGELVQSRNSEAPANRGALLRQRTPAGAGSSAPSHRRMLAAYPVSGGVVPQKIPRQEKPEDCRRLLPAACMVKQTEALRVIHGSALVNRCLVAIRAICEAI